jgi:hypothetical protein
VRGQVLADVALELDFGVQGHGLVFMSQIGLQRLVDKRKQLCILMLYSAHPTAYVDGAGDGGGGQRSADLGEQQVRRILCCA